MSEALYLLTSSGQHHGALYLQPRHPLSGLPLSQGGPVLLILDENHLLSGLLRRNGLLGRSLYSTHRCGTSSLRSNGSLPYLDHLLLWCGHTSSAPGQALQKQRQGDKREPKGNQRHSGKLSIFLKLPRIGCSISRSTATSISHNSLPTSMTCKQASFT
jgi:hypothetical protein